MNIARCEHSYGVDKDNLLDPGCYDLPDHGSSMVKDMRAVPPEVLIWETLLTPGTGKDRPV